jgi:hypothetical protein
MTNRALSIGTVAVARTLAGACTSAGRDAVKTTNAADAGPPGPLQLAAFDDGVGGVAENVAAPVWRERDAVAANDGTSVFSVRHAPAGESDRLVRLDPRFGTVMKSWVLPAQGLSVAAVAPKAGWIALTDRRPGYGDQGRTSTVVATFETFRGTETHHLTLTGDVQPEAFSTDGSMLFALNYLGDHYRVQTVALDTGARSDTSDRNKVVPPEDMHGRAVHGVMSKDGTLLATLYRNPGDADEPAFVHILDLAHGWSYCADLPAPFGTGAPGTDQIELTPTGTVVVAAPSAARLAEIHIDDVRTPGDSPVRVAYRPGTIPSPDAPFASMPGFEYVIGTIAG